MLSSSVLHSLPEFAQTQAHWVSEATNHFTLCLPLLLPSIFPRIRALPATQLFKSGSQSIGASASAPVLPMNISRNLDWFPLGLTGLTSLLSKGLSRVFSNSTVQKHPILLESLFFIVQLSLPLVIEVKSGVKSSIAYEPGMLGPWIKENWKWSNRRWQEWT